MLYYPVKSNIDDSIDYYPAYIRTYRKYHDVNNDANLRKNVTTHFLNKMLTILEYTKHKELKKHFKVMNGKKGYDIMYNILRIFVKKGRTNWYDLREQEQLVIDYIIHVLSKY